MAETVAAETGGIDVPAAVLMHASADRRRLRLMIVDSDVRTARVLAELLVLDGFAVEVASDGKEAALRMAMGPLPDVLIVNVTVPTVDGLAVTRLARARDPGLPVLLITAYPHLGTRWGPTQGPPPVVYAKPLDYAELVAALATMGGPVGAARPLE